MNLSSKAQEFAFNQFLRDRAKLAITHKGKINDLEPKVNRVWGTEQLLKDHYVEYVQQIVKARVDSYIDAYKKFNEKLTPGDIDDICTELQPIVAEVFNDIWSSESNIPKGLKPHRSYIEEQFEAVIPVAKQDLQLAMQEMTIGESNTSMPVVDFSFIADTRMRNIIERDYKELQQLNPDATPKSVLILSGGIIEGLLIDAIVKSGYWNEEEAFKRSLKDMIHPAKMKGIIIQDSISEWVRSFRNIVHPAKEIKENLLLTKDHAKHARTSVDVVISEIRQWHTSNP
jgi:hypothetical protein